ncbi:MAG: hypothetical protein V4712_15265 [Pseudomonadota bacterium]
MVRVSPPAFSVASGELSELMYGRRDFVRFQNGARALRGFIPLPEGPVTRVPGTRFMGYARGDGLRARLMAFVFRDEDAVLLEFTNGHLRFWRGGALILDGGLPYEITTPYDANAIARLRSLQSSDRAYLVDGGIAPQTLSRLALTNWTIAATAFTGGPFAPRNLDQTKEITASAVTGAVTLTATSAVFTADHIGTQFQLYEIDTSDTPYWTADLPASIGDKVYYSGRVYEIVAFDDSSGFTGSVAPVATPVGPSYTIADDNQVSWTFIVAGNTGGHPAWSAAELLTLGTRRHLTGPNLTIEVTGFAIGTGGSARTTGINPPVHSEGNWLSEKSGPVWKALHDGNGIVRITGVTTALIATGTVEKRLPDGLLTKPTYRWAEQAWSNARGWPVVIGGFEQRQMYAGTKTEPRTLWTSVIGGTTNMTTGANDDDGFSYIMTARPRKTGPIRSMVDAGDVLFIGTSADELSGRSTDLDRAFARETAKFSIDSTEGCGIAEPVVVNSSPVFIDKSGLRLITMAVDGNTGRFRPEILTQIARHILSPGATRLVYQSVPVPILWMVLEDGDLAALTYSPTQQVVGFHRHDIGGGFVEDIEVLPSDDGRSEHLWLVVRRTLNGSVKRCIERMEHPFINLTGTTMPMADAWHQFCAFRWQGAAGTVIPCPDHLEGQAVLAWTDLGAFAGTVTAGALTLPRAVTSAIIGLDGTARQRFDTLDLVSGQPDGGDDGRLRAHRATGVRLHRSAGGTVQVVGITDAKEIELSDATPLINLDAFQTPTLHDGIVEAAGMKGWDHQQFLRFRPDPGAPLTITARTPTIMITDD